MIRSTVLVVLCLSALNVTETRAQAQSTIPGWQWRLDRSAANSDSSAHFDRMPPGWHITTGPSGLLYSAIERASGVFSLVADFVVFPETTESGFGIFLGGAQFEGSSPTYIAALLRRDGALSVIRRTGGAESVLVPWVLHSTIKPHPGSGTVTNRLRLHASADSLRVFVNDSSVARIKLGASETAGQFGFRLGERVNLHITILDHIRHLAPARSR